MAPNPERDTDFVKGLSPYKLECRTIRHQWNLIYFGPAADAPVLKDGLVHWNNSNLRRTACERCETIRDEFFNEVQILKALKDQPFKCFYRRYYYVKGYLYTKNTDMARPESRDYHYELFKRMTNG